MAVNYRTQTRREKQIVKVLDNIIKRILMVPTSTPREDAYIETGLKDMEYNRTQKKNQQFCLNLITTITDIDNNQNWKKYCHTINGENMTSSR